MEIKNDLVREAVPSAYRSKFENEIWEAVATGNVSWGEANEFIEAFNDNVDATWGLDFVPKTIGLQGRATVTIEIETYIEVPFIHCDEDIDDAIKVALENAFENDEGVSIHDIRVDNARFGSGEW